jgi:hypothetical protein
MVVLLYAEFPLERVFVQFVFSDVGIPSPFKD